MDLPVDPGTSKMGQSADLSHVYRLCSITKNLQKLILEPIFGIFHVHTKDQLYPIKGEGKKREDLLQEDQSFSLEQPIHTTKWSWIPSQGPESSLSPGTSGWGSRESPTFSRSLWAQLWCTGGGRLDFVYIYKQN